MLKLSEIVYSSFGSKSGNRSARRFNLSDKTAFKLMGPNGPFGHAAFKWTRPGSGDTGLYRLADPRNETPKRFTGKQADYELVVPKKQEKTSKDTSNTYTVMVSRLPSWKGWPRRSFGLIFFVDKPMSSEYEYGANLYKVLPKNNAKIVVSSTPDLLNSHVFKHMEAMMAGPTDEVSDIGSFGHTLMNVVTWSVIAKEGVEKNPDLLDTDASKKASAWIRNIHYNNYDKAIELLDKALNKKTLPKIQAVLGQAYNSAAISSWRKIQFTVYKDLFQYYVEQTEKFGGWEGFLSEAFDPEKNGFKLMTTETVHNPSDKNEVEGWTEDTCMMINEGPIEQTYD